MTDYRATVVIATRNRSGDLRNAIQSALAQTVQPEVVVVDDASTDDTLAMVANEFPHVRLLRSEKALGYIVQRNRGAEAARSEVIVSIDDDAVFASTKTIEQTLLAFDHNRIAVVTIPYINVHQDQVVRQRATDCEKTLICGQYIGTAHALRRSVFIALGMYRTVLVHQYEELDYVIRLLDAGFFVRAGTADPIHHLQSAIRSADRIVRFEARNSLLFAWLNVPLRYLLPHVLGTAWNQLIDGIKRRNLAHKIVGLWCGFRMFSRTWSARSPVRPRSYKLFRQLRGRPPMLLTEEILGVVDR